MVRTRQGYTSAQAQAQTQAYSRTLLATDGDNRVPQVPCRLHLVLSISSSQQQPPAKTQSPIIPIPIISTHPKKISIQTDSEIFTEGKKNNGGKMGVPSCFLSFHRG